VENSFIRDLSVIPIFELSKINCVGWGWSLLYILGLQKCWGQQHHTLQSNTFSPG